MKLNPISYQSSRKGCLNRAPRITVIGSLNMDLVTITNTVPQAGETVTGEAFKTVYGGKGANQAVACARLGAEVHMIGCVGADPFGNDMITNLQQNGVHCEHVRQLDTTPSGIASITISDGDNRIIVVPGANGELKAQDVRKHTQLIKDADLVLLQLEIPMESVIEAVHIAQEAGVPVMLNPAPADKLDPDLLHKIQWLTPNEHELQLLFPTDDTKSDETEGEPWRELLARMPERIIMTKGGDGALWCGSDGQIHHATGHQVDVVDTTGAGDTFNGALAVALAEGRSLSEAIHWAVGAGALSVTKFGAQGGMPMRDELEAWITSR